MSRRPPGLIAFALAALAPAAPAVAATERSQAAAPPACFGAAARDPEAPCVNRALSFTAIPSPSDAALQPSAPCGSIVRTSPLICAFGVSKRSAVSTVALIGDSHSTHWRAAVAVVAEQRRWRATSINRDSCPFTFARTPTTPKERCSGWSRSVVRWLGAHPEVRTAIVSANSGSGVVPSRGQTGRATKINGYLDAWNALPPSVAEIFVLRDVPHSRAGTRECVRRAVARRRNPGVRCSRPRAGALRPDLEAVAAQQAMSQRVKLIDLSQHMCDAERCYPVVGGALVIKDIGHLTRTFSATLGPYLGRAIARLQG